MCRTPGVQASAQPARSSNTQKISNIRAAQENSMGLLLPQRWSAVAPGDHKATHVTRSPLSPRLAVLPAYQLAIEHKERQ